MADKKTSKEQIGNALAPLKAKADMVDRLAEIMGCDADGLVEAMELMQGHVQAIRNLVEPEVVDDHPASLSEACRALVNRYHWARDAAMGVRERLDGAAARIAELEAELEEKCARIADLNGQLADAQAWAAQLQDALNERNAELAAARAAVEDRIERTPIVELDAGANIYREALADFAIRVLSGQVLVSFREAR